MVDELKSAQVITEILRAQMNDNLESKYVKKITQIIFVLTTTIKQVKRDGQKS